MQTLQGAGMSLRRGVRGLHVEMGLSAGRILACSLRASGSCAAQMYGQKRRMPRADGSEARGSWECWGANEMLYMAQKNRRGFMDGDFRTGCEKKFKKAEKRG